MVVCRVVGAVLGLAPVMGYMAGDVATATVVVTSCMAVAWQLWLFRPGVKVNGSTVLLQGLVSDRSLPICDVDSFTVAGQRQPGDLLDRSVHLVINMDDGSVAVTRWVVLAGHGLAVDRRRASSPHTITAARDRPAEQRTRCDLRRWRRSRS